MQIKKNDLLKQQDLQLTNMRLNIANTSLEAIIERIFKLGKRSNEMVNQVHSLTQPRNAITFLRNPELVKPNTKAKFITIISILSLLGFFCISFIVILIPNQKIRKD